MAAPRAAVMRFRAVIQIRGVNPYVLVSAARARELAPGWRKPMPVRYRIHGGPAWPISLMPVGDGRFYLYLHGPARAQSKTAVGDRVEIELARDDGYRGGPDAMPAWLAKALRASGPAKAAFDALTPSRQKEIVRYAARLVSDEARARNADKIVRMLGGERGRLLGRTWKDGK